MGYSGPTNVTVSTERLAQTGNKESWQAYLTGIEGMLQPLGTEITAMTGGRFFQESRFICSIVDILESDRMVIGSDRYTIGGVEKFDFGQNPHLEIVLRLPNKD
jgi:hypothetical protein